MPEYLLSVDGGGTQTEFCISDINGNIIKSFFSGCTNYKSVGKEIFFKNLKKGFDNITEDLNIDCTDLAYVVFGISGCDSRNDYDLISNQIKKLNLPKEKFYLCNDAVLAFYAQAEEPGIVIISGTGSIVLGIGKNGEIGRVGGWGYNFSDLGSGYWIGNEALKRTLLYCDNCYEYSTLYDEVRKYFNSKSFNELPYKITGITNYYEIAKVAEIVGLLADEGENISKEILKEGASYLCTFTERVYMNLGFLNENTINIVFSGGVLKSSYYKRILKEMIIKNINESKINFIIQENSPAYGGIKYAKRRYSRCIKDEK